MDEGYYATLHACSDALGNSNGIVGSLSHSSEPPGDNPSMLRCASLTFVYNPHPPAPPPLPSSTPP